MSDPRKPMGGDGAVSIGTQDLASLLGGVISRHQTMSEGSCREHTSAMEQLARKIAEFNRQARLALLRRDFAGVNRAHAIAVDASRRWEYERFLYDRCKRGEPASTAPSFETWRLVRAPIPRTPAFQPLPTTTIPRPYTPTFAPSTPSPVEAPACPTGEFWDGLRCRGSVTAPPRLPFTTPSSSIPYAMTGALPSSVFRTSARKSSPNLSALDAKGILGYIERHALPKALEIAENAKAIHRLRQTPATSRRAEVLAQKAEAFAESASLHRKSLALSGLLDDYLREQEEFRERIRPKSGGAAGGGFYVPPASPAPPPSKPPPPISKNFEYDRQRLCRIITLFKQTPQLRTTEEAIGIFMEEFNDVLDQMGLSPGDRERMITFMEVDCPSTDFFYNLVGRPTKPTPPYVSPGTPIISKDIQRALRPAERMPARLFPPTPTVAPRAPVQAVIPAQPVQPATPTGMGPGSCPPGQFWDGRRCRGSVTALPMIPGAPVATVAPMVSTGPGLTGNAFLLRRGHRG